MNMSETARTIRFYDKQLEIGVADDYALRTDARRIAGLLRHSLPQDATLLDLGCSVGLLADRLAAQSLCWRRYVGVDLSQEAIDIFRNRGLNGTELLVGNATDLSNWEPNSFDVVICAFLLQDLSESDGRKLLQDIPRVLKPDALLVLALTVHIQQPRDLGHDYRPKALADKGVPGKFTYLWSMENLREVLIQCRFQEQEVHQTQKSTDLIEVYGSWRVSQPGAAGDMPQSARR